MKYGSLQQLIQNSQSSRAYFLSLPVSMQCMLHKHDSCIHSAHELHVYVEAMERSERFARLGHWDSLD